MAQASQFITKWAVENNSNFQSWLVVSILYLKGNSKLIPQKFHNCCLLKLTSLSSKTVLILKEFVTAVKVPTWIKRITVNRTNQSCLYIFFNSYFGSFDSCCYSPLFSSPVDWFGPTPSVSISSSLQTSSDFFFPHFNFPHIWGLFTFPSPAPGHLLISHWKRAGSSLPSSLQPLLMILQARWSVSRCAIFKMKHSKFRQLMKGLVTIEMWLHFYYFMLDI